MSPIDDLGALCGDTPVESHLDDIGWADHRRQCGRAVTGREGESKKNAFAHTESDLGLEERLA
jgi:hypothetical protein